MSTKPESYKKDVILKNSTSGTDIELGVRELERDFQNKISSFAKPDQSGGSAERRALNLNQIKETWKVKGKINDEIAEGLSGHSSSYNNMEELVNDLATMYQAVDHLTLDINDNSTNAGDKTIDGYMVNLNLKFNAEKDSSQWQFNITFLKSVPMDS